VSQKRVLVTGGAGFIGSHIARAWIDRGARVVVLDNFRTGHRRNLDGIGCELVEGSVDDRDLVPGQRQRAAEVGSGGRLADASLARSDHDALCHEYSC